MNSENTDIKLFREIIEESNKILFVEMESKMNKIIKPIADLAINHEITLNGTDKNPGGLTENVKKHDEFILKAKIIGGFLIPPSIVGIFEIGKIVISYFINNK